MQSEPQCARTLVWALSRSLAATDEIDVSFSSSGYLDVSVHRVPLHALCIHAWILEVCSSGFPHSEICGSMDICSSPQLIAAYHVFHRLLVPRHPPCALLRLTNHITSVWCVWPILCLLWFVSCSVTFVTFDVSISSCSFIKRIKIFFDHVCSFQGTYFFWLYQPDENKIFFIPSSLVKYFFKSGGHLLSHTVSSAVSSAAWVLTIVFGMGTGVTPKRIATEIFSIHFYFMNTHN